MPTTRRSPSTVPAGSRFSYTSGTTGHPKGVIRAIPSTVADMLALQSRLGTQVGLDGSGTHLVTGPAYHAAPGGYAFFDLSNGADLFLMRRFDAARTLDLLETERVRHTHLVPTMMVRLLRLDEARRASFSAPDLDLVLHGAAPISPTVKRRMIEWFGPILVEYWGHLRGRHVHGGEQRRLARPPRHRRAGGTRLRGARRGCRRAPPAAR